MMREYTTIESTPPSPPTTVDAYAQNFMALAAIWAPLLIGFWFVWHVRQLRRHTTKP